MLTSPEQTNDSHSLLTCATSTWQRVRQALHDRAGGNGLDRGSLRTQLDQLISAGARIMGDQVGAFFRPYQMPESTLCPSRDKTANRFELSASLDCLQRFACYLKMRISEAAQPDIFVNDRSGGPH
jgi:hypothetical protein